MSSPSPWWTHGVISYKVFLASLKLHAGNTTGCVSCLSLICTYTFLTVLVTFHTGRLVITQALCYNSLSFISSWTTHWLCYLWLLTYCLKVSILPPKNEVWYQPHRVALKIKWANKCQDLEECMAYYKAFHMNAIFLLIFFNHIKI